MRNEEKRKEKLTLVRHQNGNLLACGVAGIYGAKLSRTVSSVGSAKSEALKGRREDEDDCIQISGKAVVSGDQRLVDELETWRQDFCLADDGLADDLLGGIAWR